MVLIDGSFGEGGGQILRTSLSLSLITRKAFRIVNIRARRRKPGLLRQHLTAIRAAAAIGRSRVTGADLGSCELLFQPDKVVAGDYEFSIGSAGSVTLVLQTILPPLMVADGPSILKLEGGTHNPQAPTHDFLEHAFLPVIRAMGPDISTNLERPGFYPAGGGLLYMSIEPERMLKTVELLERGELLRRQAIAMIANLPLQIAERELEFLRNRLSWEEGSFQISEVTNSMGPGNVVLLLLQFARTTEVFTAFGQRGVPAENVASQAADEMLSYLNSGAVAGEHLADHLMVPFAIAGGGAFKTGPLSSHARTNLEVINKFLDVRASVLEGSDGLITVRFG